MIKYLWWKNALIFKLNLYIYNNISININFIVNYNIQVIYIVLLTKMIIFQTTY